MGKTQEDTMDKLLVHFAQSKAYMDEHGKDSLAWRLKSGKLTEEDNMCLKWALEVLQKLPLFIGES